MFPVKLHVAHTTSERDRTSVLLRYFYALPAMLIAGIYGIGAFGATIIAWFALVSTGHYPAALYEFNVKYLRLAVRANGYYWLQTDAVPPYNGEPDDRYPIRVEIGPAQAGYDRVKVALRGFYLIPVMVVAYVASLIGTVAAVVTWVSIVAGSPASEPMEALRVKALASITRASAYGLLLTDQYPQAWDEDVVVEPVIAAA
jgi:hypothetical protein